MELNYNSEIILSYSNNYTCSIDYNSVYQELRDSLNEGVENIIKEYNIFEGEKLLSRIITKSIIDRLPYEKKVILLKEILCDYINTNKEPSDKYDNEVFTFFKDNFMKLSKSNL